MRELEQRIVGPRILLPVAVLRPGLPTDLTTFSAVALLDTGATASGVGPRVIEALTLRSYGKKSLLSATDQAFVAYYFFRIGLYDTAQANSQNLEPADLPYVFEEIDGFSWRRPADFDVILGMDILRRCDLTLTRNGRCTLAFG